jgi:hypothetical protein
MAVDDIYPEPDTAEADQVASIQETLLAVWDMQQADLNGEPVDFANLDKQVSGLTTTLEAIRHNNSMLAITAPEGVSGFTVSKPGSSSSEEVRRFRTTTMPNFVEKEGQVCLRFISWDGEKPNEGYAKVMPSITLTREQLEACELEIIS